jgi:hypothetical protein
LAALSLILSPIETPPKLSSRESRILGKVYFSTIRIHRDSPLVHRFVKLAKMPAAIEDETIGATDGGIATLPFPPITKAHIMNCSYHSWHPKYARLQDSSRLYAAMLTSLSDTAQSHQKRVSYPSQSLSSTTFAPTALSSPTTTNRAPSQSGQKTAVSSQPQTRMEKSRGMNTRMSQLAGGAFTLRSRTLLKHWAEE